MRQDCGDGSSVAAAPTELQAIFEARLYMAAKQLVDAGRVRQVRMLHGCRVATGFVGAYALTADHAAQHRVYLKYGARDARNSGADKPTIDSECSCGASPPCLHAVAVAIVASQSEEQPRGMHDRGGAAPRLRPAQSDCGQDASASQRLCYVLEGGTAGTVGPGTPDEIRVSVWIEETATGTAASGARARLFTARPPDGSGHYPRYVDARDAEILQARTIPHLDSRGMSGTAGFALLGRTISTGRAFWQSMQDPLLRGAPARRLRVAWRPAANGDQCLEWEHSQQLHVLLSVEPAVYVDSASGACGIVEFRYPLDLLRRCWKQPVTRPEQVAAVNGLIDSAGGGADFPRLQPRELREQPLSPVHVRLALGEIPEAVFYFVYDGIPIDSRSLREDQDTVRRLDGGVVYETPRDRDAEHRLRGQLAAFLPDFPRNGAAWLAFMVSGVPALRARGWEIAVDPRFPYRIAAPRSWRTDLRAHPPRCGAARSAEWFDLRLEVARSKVSQMARSLRAQHRLCLTGTPMETLGELWSLFDFVQSGFLGDLTQFQRRYRVPIEVHGNADRAQALGRRIAPFLLRRTKDAVARDLPSKIQMVEAVELGEQQRDFYDGIRLGMHQRVREAIQSHGLARSRITVLDALLKLRQACCDPRLVDGGAQARTIPSAKLDWLRTALPELIAEGRRILLFSQFTSMPRLIETAVKELSIPYSLLTGATRERTVPIDRFQAGLVPLFLISLKAGGTGLNLTSADTVVHYDPWWNPAVEAQATDRAHRSGQDKPVFVYKLIARHTVEEKITQLQADKQALAGQLYSVHIGSPSLLNAADLEELFAP